MKYTYFHIRNFKGITDVRLDVRSSNGPSIVTLVGLNESGKTTILEAIHSFSPDEGTNVLLSGKTLARVPPESLIPRHAQADFNGDISVTAGVELEEDDRQVLVAETKRIHNIEIDIDSLASQMWVARKSTFKLSKHVKTTVSFNLVFSCRDVGKRKYHDSSNEGAIKVYQIAKEMIPKIKYFPTFLFEFPEKIYLNTRDDDGRNLIYREMFQDVLDANGHGYNIKDHILDRLGFDQAKHGLFSAFFNIFIGSFERGAIESVVAEAGATVTAIVMKRWNEVFADKIQNKEIVLEFETTKSQNSEQPEAVVRFFVKEGLQKFTVSERSLGFRWFLCFLLFTQFRASSDRSQNTLFLFDEPASNLHARAQQQLIESFLTIVGERNALIYSTHSHYMINPAWLETAYIIENAAIQYDAAEFVSSWATRQTQINAEIYRRFVGWFPEKRSYFQPILDKLDYSPSSLEFTNKAIFVEGKSDYYIIKYVSDIILERKFDIIPSTGANDLGPLISLYLGWGKDFIVLLDSDKAGAKASKRYVEEYLLPESTVATLAELIGDEGIKAVESILDENVIEEIKRHYEISRSPSKKDIMRYFQEAYAARRRLDLSQPTIDRFDRLFVGLQDRMSKLDSRLN